MRVPSISLFRPTVVRAGVRTKTAVWWIKWIDPDTGKIVRQSTGTKNKRAARVIANQQQLAFAFPKLDDPTDKYRDLIWKDFRREFIDRHAASRADATLDAYDNSLKSFDRFAGHQRLREIDARTLAEFVKRRLNSGVTPQTVDKELRTIRTALRIAVEWSYLAACPTFKNLFVGHQQGDRRVVPDADLTAIAAALNDPAIPVSKCSVDWWRTLFQTVLFTGMRTGEALKLRWDRVDFEAETITVFHATSKGRRTRVYPNAGNLLTKLRDWRESQQPAIGDLVFPHSGTSRRLYPDWHCIQDFAGIPPERHHRLKDLRSTCATQLIADGASTLTVKTWLGHASVVTTENYYARADEAQRAAAGRRKVVG